MAIVEHHSEDEPQHCYSGAATAEREYEYLCSLICVSERVEKKLTLFYCAGACSGLHSCTRRTSLAYIMEDTVMMTDCCPAGFVVKGDGVWNPENDLDRGRGV
jgi:hypothetical protein